MKTNWYKDTNEWEKNENKGKNEDEDTDRNKCTANTFAIWTLHIVQDAVGIVS